MQSAYGAYRAPARTSGVSLWNKHPPSIASLAIIALLFVCSPKNPRIRDAVALILRKYSQLGLLDTGAYFSICLYQNILKYNFPIIFVWPLTERRGKATMNFNESSSTSFHLEKLISVFVSMPNHFFEPTMEATLSWARDPSV